MRKWKNNELPIPRKSRIWMYVGITGSFGLAALHYFEYGYLDIMNYIAIIVSGFLLYCIKFGGAYKIAVYLAERKARQSDNDWHPKWYK